jgi:hypothetical protein
VLQCGKYPRIKAIKLHVVAPKSVQVSDKH